MKRKIDHSMITRFGKYSSAILFITALSACATTPDIREIDGPIILDAPDSVVTAEPAPGGQAQNATGPAPLTISDDDLYEPVSSVPVTPINCPAGSSPQTDGSCMLDS